MFVRYWGGGSHHTWRPVIEQRADGALGYGEFVVVGCFDAVRPRGPSRGGSSTGTVGDRSGRPRAGWRVLTRTELAVVRLIGSGLTNGAAADLGLSPNTFGTHVRSIFAKLGIHSRVQLANARHSREAELSGRSPAPPGTPD